MDPIGYRSAGEVRQAAADAEERAALRRYLRRGATVTAHAAGPPPSPQVVPVLLPPVCDRRQPPPGLRVAWSVLAGWWVAGLAIAVGYLLVVSIVGLAAGMRLLHLVPQVLSLRAVDAGSPDRDGGAGSPGLWERAAWFLLAGWWLAAVWLAIAYIVMLVGSVRCGSRMLVLTPTVLVLARSEAA